MSYLEFSKKHSEAIIAILLFLFIFIAYDTYVDYISSAGSIHIFTEVMLLITTFAFFVTTLRKYIAKSEDRSNELVQLKREYKDVKQKLSHYKKDIHEFLKINFIEWKLTKSEKDIALLLFKGCTGKEISEIRTTNYQTVRTQISSIYRKAKVKNHNQFMATLMEDLL